DPADGRRAADDPAHRNADALPRRPHDGGTDQPLAARTGGAGRVRHRDPGRAAGLRGRDVMATALAQLIPLAFASGLNIYATVAVLGLCEHFHLVDLPDQFRAFDHPAIIGIALAMYLVEFVADKIPWFDSVWDAVHTVVRPIGGALIAVNAIGHASPVATALAALLGGSIAMTTHVTKAGTRAAVNTS